MVVAFRAWTEVARQGRPSYWMLGHTLLHLQGGNGGGPVSSLGEEVGKDSTAEGGRGEKQEWWEVKALWQRPTNCRKFELWLQPAELTDCWCNVYTRSRRCTGYGTRCTVFTVLDVCKERSEGCQPSALGGINSANLYQKKRRKKETENLFAMRNGLAGRHH